MKFTFLIKEALGALRSNLLRSLLTVVGIVVGIFSVTAMLALGAGLSANVLERFNSFAQGDLSVSGEITFADFNWISEQPYVTNTLASRSISGTTVLASLADFTPTVQTVVGDYSEVQSYKLVSGAVFDFTNPEFDEAVAVVSDGFAEAVLEETGQAVLNQTIAINGQNFSVIGVIESSSMLFTRGDGIVLVPYKRTIGSISNTKDFSGVAVLLEDSSYYEIAGQHILKSLNASRQLVADSEEMFSVETAQSFIEAAKETTGMISLFLGLVGGIALFVGGIGTMNMMLTTVTERTREIGLRKAVGARDRDILLQILIESVTLTSFGGLIGILLTLLIAEVANQVFAESEIIKILVSMDVVITAATVAVVVGVVFGLYPARRASRLQPVDALRSE